MKKQVLIIILLLLNSLIVFIPTDIVRGDPNPSGGNIVGDTVYWENNYANLSVYPHTSTNIVRQKQWANLTWKASDNVIDVAFRFNDSLSYGKIWRWNGDSWVTVTMQHTTYNGKHYYYYAGFNVVQDATYRFKWEYDTIANTSGKWWLFTKLNEHTVQQALDNNWYVALDPWWDSNWAYYKTITIASSYIDATLTNFPILVAIDDTTADKCDGGNSIRFLNTDNSTEYDYEIEKWVDGSDRIVWVEVPSISSSSDTVFLMYYDNNGASDNQNPTGVWDANFIAVYHMSSTTTTLSDSTENRDGTKDGVSNPAQGTGQIGYAQNFERSNEDKVIADKLGAILDMTVECWYKPESGGVLQHILENTYIAAQDKLGFTLRRQSDNKLSFTVHEVTAGIMFSRTSTTVLNNGVNYYCAGVLDDNNYGRVFINGIQEGESTGITGDMTNYVTAKFRIGVDQLTDGVYRLWADGIIDEVRVSDTPRSNAWIKASYHSQKQTAGFLTFGNEHIGNQPPQLDEVPASQSIGIGIIPDLYVLCTDADNDNLNATWWSNSSGSWLQFASNWTSFANNTNITQTNSNFSTYSTMYWWSVHCTDGIHWTNETYHFTTKGGATTSINASTGIEETNATLHGYISEDGSGNYNYGFWVGTTTPLTEGNTDHNMTGSGYVTVTGNRDFSHNDTNLTQGIHYYVRAWVSNATWFDSSDNEEDFWTKCDDPSGFTATVSGCNVALAWTKGTGADNTTVVRKVDSYPANQTDGTVIYNDSGVSYSDTTARGSHQYYRAWSWVGDKHSDGNVSANISVPPCPPTNIDTNVLSNNTFDIVWTKGVGAVNTVVRGKLNSHPSSVTDGIQVYNGTGTQINIQYILNYYYSSWSYANITYSSQVNITMYGGLVLNCYDEETNDSLYFDVSISNQDGSHTYERYNNTNPLIINISQLPIGDDVKITVSAASNYSEKSETFTGYPPDENYTITYIILSQIADSKSTTNVTCINEGDDAHSYPPFTLDGDLITILPDNADKFTKIFVNYSHEEYSGRLYYRDIDEYSFSFLNTYLPPTEDKQLYLLEVIDEAGNTVQDAHIEVKRSVNGTFVVVSRLLTDANGQADIDLIADRDYIFIISKDGYITENASWTPGPDIFTHTFKIIWEVIPFEPDTFGDIISFYGTLYVNNTMMVTFYDLNNEMIDSHFTIYEDYNNTLTYMGEYNGTTSNDITFWINVDNATRLHIIVLYMNHSTLGEVINYRIVVYPVHVDRDEGNWLENLIQGVVGNFDYGYVITFIWYLPCVLLIAGLAAIGHPGIGILGAGFYSIWITWYLFIPEEAKILTFASIALVTGSITLFLVKGKKVIH